MKEYKNRHDKPLVNKPITEKEYTLTKLVSLYNKTYNNYYCAISNDVKMTFKRELDSIKKRIDKCMKE